MNIEDIRICSKCSVALENNAFDILSSAIVIFKDLESGIYHFNQYKLKTAILCVATGIELLLKSKIAETDWRQIYQNPEKARESNFKTGDFISVKFSNCIERIEKVCGITIDKTTNQRIKDIEKIRNRIIHFHDVINNDKYISLISYGIDVFIEFYRKYIFKLGDHYDPDRTKIIDIELKGIKEYTSVRLETIKKNLIDIVKPRNNYLIDCGNCFQEYTIVLKDNNTLLCVYCNEENDIKEMADLHTNSNYGTKVCPACKRDSMVAVHMHNDEEEAWDCIICGYYINHPTNWANKNEYSWTGPIRSELII